MRLTLRTLLAYLDDILDPSDKEELAEKIESSEFAQDLVHRTRDTMRRLRLSAPQVVGSGMGLDPNSVAEYLDNVLPPEQVGDYERICLESDVHLAEAAACHHVLTMVLGEPADVDPRARQRMYMIPAESRERKRLRAEPPHVPAISTTVATTAPAATPIASRAAATFEVPEYLRTGAWWQSRIALAGLGFVLLAAIMLYIVSGLMGWFDEGASIAALTTEASAASDSAPVAAATDEAQSPTVNDGTNGAATTIGEPRASNAAPSVDPYATAGQLSLPPLPAPPQPLPPGGISSTAETPATPDSGDSAIAANRGAADRYSITEAGAASVDVTELPAVGTNANVSPANPIEVPEALGESGSAGAATGEAPPVPPALPQPSEPPDDAIQVAIAQPHAGQQEASAHDLPSVSPELGTYLGGKTVLLRYDDVEGNWFRIQPRSAVTAGERLLALPEFRPKITLASGVHLDMSGGTQVSMSASNEMQADGLPAAGTHVPAVELVYGRIILINTSNAEQQVRLKLGPSVGDARPARNATLAIEVERQYVPGIDPRKAPAPVMARLFAPDGGVEWQDASGQMTVDKASRWTIFQGQPSDVEPDPSPPDWIDQEPVLHLSEQRFGAPVVESALVSDRPADTQLLELFKGRDRKEVKSLVARSSIYVGLFAPFVDALRDSQLKWPTWKTHIETLRAAMAHGPESAEGVWQSLAEQRGRQAAMDLYAMLCGYNAEQIGRTPEEMKVGAVSRLIDQLENDSLDYRVLAVYDLWEITGKQLMPNPAANSTVRKQNVRRWRDRLDSGELRPVERQFVQ